MLDNSRAICRERLVRIVSNLITLEGNLHIPDGAEGIVVFAYSSGSSRHSPRNRYIAQLLQDAGFATLLIDLLTVSEEAADIWTDHLRTDTDLLSERLLGITDWIHQNPATQHLRIGYFATDTVAAAALNVAAYRAEDVGAVVSRSGRPDLAEEVLPHVQAPVLLIVGRQDGTLMDNNVAAFAQLNCTKKIEAIPGVTCTLEEPEKLELIGHLACHWFISHLVTATGRSSAKEAANAA